MRYVILFITILILTAPLLAHENDTTDDHHGPTTDHNSMMAWHWQNSIFSVAIVALTVLGVVYLFDQLQNRRDDS